MSSEQLQIVAPDERRHGEQIYDLVAKVFPDLGYFESRRGARDLYFGHSHYDWGASRIGLRGAEIVTHFGIWGYEMRIGTARVRAGGVGAVATHGDYRGRGLMDRTARAGMRSLRDHGYDVSLLFGIPNLYHKYGYVRAWAETSFFTSAGELPVEKPERPLRRLAPNRFQEFAGLYNDAYATATGTAVRPTYRGGIPWHHDLEGYFWSGLDGRPGGYVLVGRRGAQLRVQEYCGDAEQALRALGALARRWHCRDVSYETLPYRSDLAKRLRRGNCREERRYQRSGSAMIRLVNLPQAMGRLAGELGRRLRESHLAGWQGDLLVSDAEEEVLLALREGEVSLAPGGETPHTLRGGAAMAQLLIGTETPAEVIEAGGMELRGEAAALAEVLFPAQHPQLTLSDRY